KRNRKRFEEVKTLDHTAYRKMGNEWIPVEISELEKAIGLNYVNFKRTIIIPQGQFQEFLQLGNKDRTTMMKELFNLQKYEFFHKVVSLESKNNNRKNHLDGQLQQLGEIDPEQINIYSKKLLDLDKIIGEFNDKVAGLKKVEEELRKIMELIQKRDEAERNLNVLIKQEPEYNQLKIEVERYELCALSFKHLLDSLKEYRSKVQSRSELIESDKIKLETLNNNIKKLEKELGDLKPLYEKRDELKRKADELDTLLKIKQLDKSVKELESRVEKGADFWKKTERNVGDLKEENDKLDVNLTELRKNLPDIALLSNIRNWYNEKNLIERQISDINREIDKYKAKQNELINKKNILLKDYIQKGEISVDMSFDDYYHYLEISLDKIKKRQSELRVQEGHVLVKAKLGAYAENLQENSPCPLCGSLHHPDIFRSEDIEEHLESINTEKTELEKEFDTTSSIIRQLNLIEAGYNEAVYHLEELSKSKNQITKNLSVHLKLFVWDKFRRVEELDSAFSEMELKQAKIKSCELELQERAKEIKNLEKTLELARVKLENLRKELTENKTELLTLKGQLRIIEVEKYNELNEVAIYEEQTKLIKEHDRIEKAYTIDNDNLQEERKKRDLLKGRLDTNVIELENEKSAIVKIEKDIDSELANSDFKSVEEVKTILSESINIQNEKKRVDQFYKTLLENRTSFEHINKEVGGQIYDKVYHDKLNSEIRLINDQLDMFIKERVEIEINLKNLKKNIEIHNQLRKELEDVEHRSENLKTMKSLFKASGFVNYISSVYLQNLCNAANDRFFQLTRQKLSLEITPENNFQIRDYMNGGKERSVKTLSGGQTFQASLSLALALADNIQKITQSHQNFFFLDEGFGSLDREALSVVLDTLKTLRKENRTVGIISHVEEMQQEIEVHLRIENSSERGSIVHYSWEE
ncbi:MAG: SbcC/MukB-like Walker B domain-containing protein, partial [Lascolabacillus sp.]